MPRYHNYTYTSGDELIAYLLLTYIDGSLRAEVRITLIGDMSFEWKATTNKPNGMNYAQGNTRYYASVSDGWLNVAPLMYTIRTNDPNTEYGIKQPFASSINPCHMTIYWGDGSENTFLTQNSTLSPERFASHNYTGVGDYTITIISDQAGAVKQMPQITFYEHIGNNLYESDTLLTASTDPFPQHGGKFFRRMLLRLQSINLHSGRSVQVQYSSNKFPWLLLAVYQINLHSGRLVPIQRVCRKFCGYILSLLLIN